MREVSPRMKRTSAPQAAPARGPAGVLSFPGRSATADFPGSVPHILTRSQEMTREMLSAMSHNPTIRLPTMITWSVRVLIQVRNLASSARLWPGLIMA